MGRLLTVLIIVIVFGRFILEIVERFSRALRSALEQLENAQAGEVGERKQRLHPPLRQSPPRGIADPTAASSTRGIATLQAAPRLARFDRLTQRTANVIEALRQTGLAAAIVTTIEQRLLDASLTARRSAAERSERSVREGIRQAARVEAALARIDDVIRQRQDPRLGALLREADALAQALLDPVLANARRMRVELGTAQVITVIDETAHAEASLLDVALLPLPSQWPTDVLHWPVLVQALGRRLYEAQPCLAAEIDEKLLPALDPFAESEELLASPWPRWTAELFGDVLGVLTLGAVYLQALATRLARPDQPVQVQVAVPQGDQERIAPHLRVLLGCHLLSQTGAADAAQRIAATWRTQHPAVASLLLQRDGQWYVVDEPLLLAPGQTLVTALAREPWMALGGKTLQALTSDSDLRRSARAVGEAATQLGRGRPLMTRNGAIVVAAAVTARLAEPGAGAKILHAARSTLASWLTASADAAARVGDSRVAEGPSGDDLDATDAVLLATILAPPPARSWFARPHER